MGFEQKFSRNNSSVYCYVFFHWLTFAQNTILRQRMQVEFNASHIYNTRITSVNVGSINLHRTMNNILMTFQSRSAKVDPTNIHKSG